MEAPLAQVVAPALQPQPQQQQENGSSPLSYVSDRIKDMKHIDPVSIEWQNVSLEVPVKGQKTNKAILSNVSGQVKAAHLTAIMGATGCGKSSLLNILAGCVEYVRGAKLTGRLLTNGRPRVPSNFARIAGYVTQDDTLYAQLTVVETLTLAAHFALGESLGTSGKELDDYVSSVINDLGLKKARDTCIGDDMTKGVSGGERKRVCIGVELISNPSVLFLDEPTSGLDSFSAASVMSSLKDLASTGRTICAVVHQPRSSIFAMVDELLLLSEGRMIYSGAAKDADEYFRRQGFSCPSHSSPADFLLDTIAKDFRTPKLAALSQQRIDRLTQAYQIEEEKQQRHKYIHNGSEEEGRGQQGKGKTVSTVAPTANGTCQSSVSGGALQEVALDTQHDKAAATAGAYGASWWTQLYFLAWRNLMVASRNKIGRMVGLAIPCFFGSLFGAIWSNRDTDPQKAIQDKIGLLFMACILMGFAGMSEFLQTIPIEKRLIQKERASGFYSLSSYYLSKVLTCLPFSIAGPMLFCCIIYPAAGLRMGAEHFFVFLAVITTEVIAAGSLGMFLGTLAADPEIANAMAPAFNILFTVFNGVLINVSDLPYGSRWVADIGYNRYAFEALAINEFRDRAYPCGDTADPAACVTNGNQILKLYTYQDGKIGFCILWMVVITCVIHVLAFFNLWRNATKYLAMEDEGKKAAGALAPAAVLTVEVPRKEEEETALEEVNSRTGTNGSPNMAPVPAVDVSWEEIELKVPIKKKGEAAAFKTVLDRVSGHISSQTLTAIMGPTGSGKSSLLGVLAGRIVQMKGGELSGRLFTNGHARDAAAFKKISVFVLQDDLLFGHLTVKETLTLAAHFALGSSIEPQAKEALVAGVISDLGLAKTINTIIGDDRARGVSGGERKRVSIGVELISQPSVLFLDEPTSGLDAFQSLSVMEVMQRLARAGRTVIASIHQPRSAIYALLDQLLLVSEGRTIFMGPALEASKHFAAQGFVCPPRFNESDFFLDTISMDYRSSELEHATRERIALLADVWASKENGADEEAGAPAAAALTNGADNKKKPSCRDLASAVAVVAHKRGGWLSNLKYLTWRASNSAYRNVFSITLRIFLNVVFALIFSAIWSDVKHDQTGIQSLVGLIFMVSTNVAFSNTQAVINVFPIEAGIIRKEQASNSYSLSAYFLSKFISELPLNLFGPCIFATLVFWLTGFEHSLEHYGIFLAIVCLSALSAIGTGTFISTLAPNVEVAGALSPVFNVLFLIFSGILINTNSLPAGAKWVPSISPIKWTVSALALNEFTDATFSCTPGQRCLATGKEVLALYSWDESTIGNSLLYIVIIMCVLLMLGYLRLRQSLPTYMKVQDKKEL